MDDQRELSDYIRKLHDENNSKHKVIGSRLCYYSFKFNHRISEELYEGHLHFSFDPHGPPTNVVFVKVAQDDAETIFQRTAAANDGVVLRPWTYLFSKQKEFEDLPEDTDLRKGIWVLCYDRFEHNLKHWTNLAKPKPKGIAYNDKLKLPIKTGDDRLNEFWCNSISCDVFVKKVLHHPFLLNADQRMRLFDHYDTMRNCPITADTVNDALALSAFDNFISWNSTSTVNNMNSFMSGVYYHSASTKKQKKKANYSGNVSSLLRYLRNLNHHYQKHGLVAGSWEDVERGVTTHFRGFLELIYRHLEL
ncbi:hypothetical protein L3X38_029418 [Prunus dulcis]|uniref:KEN domain-containing protein n=1 Tax=Prunus dulcis TaxID=3755 RepID=A0AAD4Z260_PRUDU|nr:hypothetical protein L3X38_029418 [Prunus dulcis]